MTEKLAHLRQPPRLFLIQLQTAGSGSGDVYVSIIPFNRDVNIGAANYVQPWLDWSTWNTQNGYCTRPNGAVTNASQKSACSGGNTWHPDSHSSWNGCVMDRVKNYDTTATSPTSAAPETYFPPDQYDSCPLQMMGLNTNFATMKNLVDLMYPRGNTRSSHRAGLGLAVAGRRRAAGVSKQKFALHISRHYHLAQRRSKHGG